MTPYLIVLIGLTSFKGIQAIRCSCEIHQSCINSEVCETEDGGVCFASLFRSDEGEVTHLMKCIEPELAIPKGRPLICEYR